MLGATVIVAGSLACLTFDIPSVDSYRYTSLKEIQAQDDLKRSSNSTTVSSEYDDFHVMEVKVKLSPNTGYSMPSTFMGQTVTSEQLILAVKYPGFVPTSMSGLAASSWVEGGGAHCIMANIGSSSEFSFYAPFNATSATQASASVGVEWALILRRSGSMGLIGDITVVKSNSITKYVCNDASIDERKSYGQPNKDGINPADANGFLRSLNFGSYTYNGGLFVGNVKGDSIDKSRVGRIQLWPQSASGTGIKAAAVTLFATGQRSDMEDTFFIGAYVPSSGSGNLATTESTSTWTTRWDVDPTIGDGYHDLNLAHLYPLDYLQVTPSTQQRLYSWNLTFPVENNEAEFGMPANPAMSNQVPPGVHQYISLATLLESGSDTAWQYFASREYIAALPDEAPFNTFPYSDARARLFLLTEN